MSERALKGADAPSGDAVEHKAPKADAIEQKAGSPVSVFEELGVVPDLEPDLLSQYSALASRILFSEGEHGFTIAVTSAQSGEGVTTTAVGVALALAQSTAKDILLVDANVRKPALHDLFSTTATPGLHEMLVGHGRLGWRLRNSAPPDPAGFGMRATSIPNLWLLPSGAEMEQPTRLMTSDAVRACVHGLRSRFDYVVLDAPPVLSAVDAVSVCRQCDGVAVVIRTGLTPREDASRALALLQGAPVMGVVLNGE